MTTPSLTTNASAATTAQPIISRFNSLKWNGRTFHLVEAPNQATRLGPWCILENNADGKPPIVIREGISGSRTNGLRVLALEVKAIALAAA